MTSPGRLGNNPEFQALKAQMDAISRRLGLQQDVTRAVSVAADDPTRRFRVGVFLVPAQVEIGTPIVSDVAWSSPMPSDTYKVDLACSAPGMKGPAVTVTRKADYGCTVSFVAPVVVPAGTVCVAIAIAPPN